MNNQHGDQPAGASSAISLRPMTIQDIPFGLSLSGLAGWNQTEADWRMLLEGSTGGCFIACWDGIEAGTVTTVTYQNRLSWIGMMQVAPHHRRLGIGSALLRAAIQAVEAQGPICLDATPAGRPLYEKHGFQPLYPLSRWLRPPAPLRMQPGLHCQPLSQEALHRILATDRPVFGADRSGILSTLQRNTPSLALYLSRDHEILGFCLGRAGLKYTQIGPLIADSLDIARNLLLNALQTCAQQQVILDIALQHPGWNQYLLDLGFVEQRPFTRMHLGEYSLPEGHSRQYAIAGPEMG